MKGPMHDIDRLRFRRQFILGERFVETFPRWKRLELRPEIRLTVHPDLPAVRVQREGMSVVLLGYMINPYRPRATDLDIVARLLAHLESGEPTLRRHRDREHPAEDPNHENGCTRDDGHPGTLPAPVLVVGHCSLLAQSCRDHDGDQRCRHKQREEHDMPCLFVPSVAVVA